MIKRRDITVGMRVYHSVLTNRGPGIVQGFRVKDNLGYPTAHKVKVTWANAIGGGFDTRVTWCRLAELRRTPKT